MFSRIVVVLCLSALAAGALWAAEDSPELRAEQAKAAYLANPSAGNRMAMEKAVAALEAAGRRARPGDALKAQVGESEPNDTAGTADVLIEGEGGDGDIAPAGDIDWWVRGGAAVGDLIFAFVDATESTTGTDSQINIFAHDGTTLIEFDDDDGPGLSSCAAGSAVPQAGDVYFRVNEFGDNGTIEPYALLQDVVPPAAAAAEAEPNDTSGTATPVTAKIMTGSALAPDVDYYSFAATAGDRIAVIMDDDPNGDSNNLDTELDILDTDGTTVLVGGAGDDNSGNDSNCAGVVIAPANGTYFVRVGDGGLGGGDTDYRFVVMKNELPVIPVELMEITVSDR